MWNPLVSVLLGLVSGIMNLIGCTTLLLPRDSPWRPSSMLSLLVIPPLLVLHVVEIRPFTVGMVIPGVYFAVSHEGPCPSVPQYLWEVFTSVVLAGGPALLLALWSW